MSTTRGDGAQHASAIERSDVWIAVAAFLVAAFTAALNATRQGEDPFTLLALATLVAQSVPLLWRRRHPVLVWVAVGFFAATYGIAHWSDPILPIPAFVALSAVFEWCGRRVAIGILVLTSVVAVMATALTDDPDALDWGVIVLMLVISPAVGELLRARHDQLAALERRNVALRAEQAQAVESARLLERQRIARELHDVVTHNVTMLVVQAEAAASVATMSDVERVDAFDGLASGGRAALSELRQLLGVLRETDDAVPSTPVPSTPVPGIAQAGELVERARRAGLAVEFHGSDATEPLPVAVDLAGYRVIQEGLTNVIRHASATHASVAVDLDGSELVITVDDDGVGGQAPDGVGLTGIRERMRLLGGAVDTGRGPLGGFRLLARIPIGSGA
jgi:signal transduction histidine kinase